MNQLESDLSEALSLRASGIPAESGARLRGVDYHPRTSRLSPRLTVGSLAGVAAATGVIASVVIMGGSQPAFAGWSPSPTPTSTRLTSAAGSACQARLAATPALPGAAMDGTWSVAASDVRGPFTLVIYQSGGTDATCLIGPSITIVSRSSEDGGSVSASGSESGTSPGKATSSITVGGTGTGDIKHFSVAHLDSTSQGPYTVVDGQVDPVVTAVTLLRTGGNPVQASTVNGWFVAWWPGSQDTTSAEITTAVGAATQKLDTLARPPLPPAGSGSCIGSDQTTSSPVTCSGGGPGTGPDGPAAPMDRGDGGSGSVNNGG
ncbi:MAG: hypothetical protein ABSF33_11365 [Acidimicrobiales bacterium]